MREKRHLDDERTVLFYQALLEKHGHSFRALNWGSAESQRKRFEVLSDVGMKSGDRILDVGCGLADFYAWILEQNPGVNYTGIDITPSMTQAALNRFPDVEITNKTIFDLEVSVDVFDYVVASGIFFLRREDPMLHMEKVISAMFQKSAKGIAFNSLSTWALEKTDREFYADPQKVLEFCRKLSPNIILRHDYHPADFTVYVFKR